MRRVEIRLDQYSGPKHSVLVCHAKFRFCPVGSEASMKNFQCFLQFQNTLKMKKSKKTISK